MGAKFFGETEATLLCRFRGQFLRLKSLYAKHGFREVTFLPWVGANYESDPHRLLVLGESHYEWDDRLQPSNGPLCVHGTVRPVTRTANLLPQDQRAYGQVLAANGLRRFRSAYVEEF